jgi:hypothetical protein
MFERMRWMPPAIFALATMQLLWNATRVWPLSGYDGVGHAAYALTLLLDGRLPHPLEGWSTFHPPVYHAVLAALWAATSWLGSGGQLLAGRLVSVMAMLVAGRVLFRLLREREALPAASCAAFAMALFLPATQLAATTLGNEALGVAFASLALPPVLALQRDPSDRRNAALAGLFAGLALGTKFTGLFVVGACLVPFMRRELPAAAWRAAALGVLAAALVAGPIYLRNVWLTGSPVPMTRDAGVVARSEAAFVVRERRLEDYIGLSLETLRWPSIAPRKGAAVPEAFNRAHVHVWGSAYASLWFDTYMRRIPLRGHGEGVFWGPLLVGLGLLPTATMLLGLAIAVRECWRSRGRSQDAPLLGMAALALASFVAFTLRNPAIVASKGSYLLPLLVPAGLFFARGAAALPGIARGAVLCVSAAAVFTSALVFTVDLVFEPRPLPPKAMLLRQAAAQRLPHMHTALERFLPEDTRRLP